MKVLVTGATGFLGKSTLSLLVESEDFQKIIVVTRSKRTHPSPKVHVVKGDLTDPECLRSVDKDVNAVIHIAGLYDFAKGYAENYLHNVVATSQVMAWMKELEKPVPIHFISTYVVGAGRWSQHSPEKLQQPLPPENRYYAYSKSLSEIAIDQSGLPYIIYRPGIIVGDSQKGRFENMNGPYYLMKTLSDLNRFGILKKLPTLPLPARQDAYLPFAPVDLVANAVVEGVRRQDTLCNNIYGIYDSHSVTVGRFIEAIKDHWKLSFRPVFVQDMPERILNLQNMITRIPPEVFRYSIEVASLNNKKFQSDFPKHQIPSFDEYKEAFFDGFEAMNGKF